MRRRRSEKACVGAVVAVALLVGSDGLKCGVLLLTEGPGTLLEAIVAALVPGRVDRRTAGAALRCWRCWRLGLVVRGMFADGSTLTITNAAESELYLNQNMAQNVTMATHTIMKLTRVWLCLKP